MKQKVEKNLSQVKSKFVLGAIVLTITSVISKILGAFYKVPLMNMIGSNGLGIFQLIFPVYSFFLVLASGGISLGMSKIISGENKLSGGAYNSMYVKCGLKLVLLLSLLSSVVLGGISVPISIMQGDKTLFVCYLALIPALVFSSLISVLKGYFQGKENMLPSGISMIIEQGVKLLAGLLLCKIFIKKSLIFAVFGAFLGISLSELMAFVFLLVRYFTFHHGKKEQKDLTNISTLTKKDCYKNIIKTSFPIMLNTIIMPLVYAVESGVTIWLLKRASIGTQTAQSLFGLEDGIVGSLINLPTVISSAIATALLPSITSSFNSGEDETCSQKSTLALRLTWLVALPCFFIFLLFAKDIVLFLYGGGLKQSAFDELSVVVDLVRLSSLNIVYVSLLSVITAILQAINLSFVPVKNLLISGVIKLILTFVLVSSPMLNIYGLVISDAVCFSLALVLNTIALKKSMKISLDLKNFVIKPILSSLVMAFVTFSIKFVLSGLINFKMLVMISILSGICVYLFTMFMVKGITKQELFKIKSSQKSK